MRSWPSCKHISCRASSRSRCRSCSRSADGARRPGDGRWTTCAARSSRAIADGVNMVVLSDRGVNKEWAPIPSLLAVAGLHHHLIREGTRTRVGLVLESGEPREVHHFALLIGYGCGAINPYLAFETLDDMLRQGLLTGIDHKTACKNYLKAAMKGVVKVDLEDGHLDHPKLLGRADFRSRGPQPARHGQVFHLDTPRASRAWALRSSPRRCCCGTSRRSRTARSTAIVLDAGGQYQWREDGEYHLFNPQTIHKLQTAVRTGNYKIFKEYSTLVNEQVRTWCTLRGLLEFKKAKPVPIEEVESVESIMKRFKIGRHELRLHQPGGARNARHRHEPHWRQEQHRGRRRRPRTLRAVGERRLEEQRHQAGRFRPVRRHQPLSGQRQGTPDQDGPGRQARRRRPVARAESLSLDRQGPLLHPGRRPHLAAAAP